MRSRDRRVALHKFWKVKAAMDHMQHRTIQRVETAAGGYDAVYGAGLLDDLAELLHARGLDGRAVLCTDSNVEPLHAKGIEAALERAGHRPLLWTMPAGEEHKNLGTVAKAYAWMAERGVERRDVVVAVGGGVVGDLSGFVAATYLRGLRLVQVATTLTAQVDSALGGKVGVDLPAGKNLVGAFHDPALVVGDATTLTTLPRREWRAGLAELLKHGLIYDKHLLDDLIAARPDMLDRDPSLIAALIARGAAVKAAVVRDDPREHGVRRILNYGHTLGHAVERTAGYGVVKHGEAVAWGMAAAARIGVLTKTCGAEFAPWQDDLLRDFGLLDRALLPPLRAADLIAATRLDKKTIGGRINWVLPVEAGSVVITSDVPDIVVEAAARWLSDGL